MTTKRRWLAVLAAGLAALALPLGLTGGCLNVKTESEIKPIHITMDVNIHVQKDLDNFFGDIDKK